MWNNKNAGTKDKFPSSWVEPASEEKLDRALVAGMILEVILDTPEFPVNLQEKQELIKSRIKNYLVRHLAGQITLDRFRTLTQCLDNWFDFYYPLLASESGSGCLTYQVQEPRGSYLLKESGTPWSPSMTEQPPSLPIHNIFLDELLTCWLESLRPNLPQRPHRKLSLKKLEEFLRQTSGAWFRLRDFERFFQVDRKTAWDYLQQFLEVGLLCHNRKRSAAVRYCLHPGVLRVEADTLRLALSIILPDLPEGEVEQLGDMLISTGGESFRLAEWEKHYLPEQLQHLISRLIAHEVLALQTMPSGAQLYHLRRRWLQG